MENSLEPTEKAIGVRKLNFSRTIELLLRDPLELIRDDSSNNGRNAVPYIALITYVSLLVYGLIVGTFAGAEQLWAAPLKVTLGGILAALLCAPSLCIFVCLSGSTASLQKSLLFLLIMLGISTLLLIGFAPIAWIFSTSTYSGAFMGLIHIIFLVIATMIGTAKLSKCFEQTGGQNSAYATIWGVIFLFVLFQMTTALRPIINRSDAFLPSKKEFFLEHWLLCSQYQDCSPVKNSSTNLR